MSRCEKFWARQPFITSHTCHVIHILHANVHRRTRLIIDSNYQSVIMCRLLISLIEIHSSLSLYRAVCISHSLWGFLYGRVQSSGWQNTCNRHALATISLSLFLYCALVNDENTTNTDTQLNCSFKWTLVLFVYVLYVLCGWSPFVIKLHTVCIHFVSQNFNPFLPH